jgi:hypothetical protein
MGKIITNIDHSQDLFSYDEADESENATHCSLGCKCSGDGANVDPKASSLALLGPSSEQLFEAEELRCRFPSISQLSLWQHYAAPHDPQLMEVSTQKKLKLEPM